MEDKTIHEQFRYFTQLFSADGYQFLRMKSFLESLEKSEEKTENERNILEAFRIVSRTCEYFFKQNDQ